jgi:NAD(P)-dependent dehydrogenase (short-subunit alcohol dehydrogenase family)
LNQVALITGASRGIGRAIAIELAGLGFDLLLNYRSDDEAMNATVQACNKAGNLRVERFRGDIAEIATRQSLLDQLREEFGRIDLLVNNAGIAPRQRAELLSTSEESFDEVIAINLKAPFFLTQALAKFMVETRQKLAAEYRPKIVTISSVSAYTASTNRGEYCISKAGVSMLTNLFASALAPHGIGVFEIRPGIIATDMTAGVKGKYDTLIANGLTPIQRWGEPEDVAKAVSAIARDLFPFSTGEVINVDGGFHLRRL